MKQESDNVRRAAAIGMFDGVHLGHRHLIQCVREEARRRGLLPTVITFANHPSTVTTPDSPVKMLTGIAERRTMLEKQGIGEVIMLDFDEKLRQLTAQEFMTLLHDRYAIDCLIVGFNNHFGSDRTLGFADYRRIGAALGIDVVQATEADGPKTSSSIIRRLLEAGNVEEAALRLGRNFRLRGRVVEGKRLGRTIGFPTANITPTLPGALVPAPGVYAVRFSLAGSDTKHPAMVNIGYRPTVNSDPFDVTIEAHLLDYDGDLYGREVKLEFVARIRNEMRFASLDELKARLSIDAAETRRILPND